MTRRPANRDCRGTVRITRDFGATPKHEEISLDPVLEKPSIICRVPDFSGGGGVGGPSPCMKPRPRLYPHVHTNLSDAHIFLKRAATTSATLWCDEAWPEAEGRGW